MIRLAQKHRIFKIGEASSLETKCRLIKHLRNPELRSNNGVSNNNDPGLSPPHPLPDAREDELQEPALNPGLVEIVTDLLCLFSSNEDRPILDAIANHNKDQFQTLCWAAQGVIFSPKSQSVNKADQEGLHKLWTLARNIVPQAWAIIGNTLHHSGKPELLFKPIRCTTQHDLKIKLENTCTSIANSVGWTTSLGNAIGKATPNHGVKGKLNFVQRRLLRHGYAKAATTNHGAVVVIKTWAVNIGHLITGDTYQTHLVPETRPSTKWRIDWAVESKHKIEIMRKILPSLPLTHLPNLVDSQLWAAAVTKPAAESHAKKVLGPPKKRRVPPLTFAPPANTVSANHWGDA